MERSAGGAGKGMRMVATDHIVFQCEEMWRLEAKSRQKWRTWEDLDDKMWI